MDVSVVIPAYGELEKIPQTLEALEFSGDFEVIIAGDELPPEDVEFLQGRDVVLDLSEERRGKAEALNQAVDLARGELLVFLDSDTRPDEGFLDSIWETYRSRGFEMGTGKLMVEGGGLLGSAINVEYMLMNGVTWLGDKLGRPTPVNGAFIIITREGFQRIGGFSRVVVEDFQMGFKADRAGLSFGYVEGAVAYTAPAGGFREWLTQRKRWMTGGWESAWESKKDFLKDLPASVAALSSCYPMLFVPLVLLLYMALMPPEVNLKLVLSATALFTSGVLFLFNRILDWGSSVGQRLGYLLWYGPMWSAFMALSLFYCTLVDRSTPDWKV